MEHLGGHELSLSRQAAGGPPGIFQGRRLLILGTNDMVGPVTG